MMSRANVTADVTTELCINGAGELATMIHAREGACGSTARASGRTYWWTQPRRSSRVHWVLPPIEPRAEARH